MSRVERGYRTRMRLGTLLLSALLGACTHKPDISVSVIQSGAVYPPLGKDCSVQFVNAEHIAILTSGEFEQLGLVSFAGPASDIDRAISAIPDAVVAAVCKMGGNAVSIANMVRTSSDVGVLQFSIWRSRNAASPAETPKKAQATTA